MAECPTVEQLGRMLESALPDPVQARLEDHVNDCARCQDVLERLTAATRMWDEPAAESRASTFLARVRALGAASRTRPPAAARPHRLPEIAGYRVEAELGRGGMGVVYRARDERLNRFVALKVLLPRYAADPDSKARFVREAQAQAAVEHDHVTPVFHVGDEGGVPFLTMPVLKGATLADALRHTPRPPVREVARIGREIAEGLAAAHDQHLIHRDIKPGNVWLEGAKRRVRILDFGLARPVVVAAGDSGSDGDGDDDDPTAAGTELLTAAGAVLGTPHYMSPEQARGQPLDPRSDLYSLGVVLHQMTAGRLPFTGRSATEALRAVAADDTPVPPLTDPTLPRALAELIARLLSKNPAGRPAGAAAVAAELHQIERGLAAALPGQAIPLDHDFGAANPFDDIHTTELMTQAPAAAPARKPRRAGLMWAAGGLVALLAGGGLLGGFLVRAAAPRAVLVVEADDPEMEVIVRQKGEVVRARTKAREFVVPPGDYTVEAADPRTGLKVRPEKVSLGKGGRETVHVWVEKPRRPRDPGTPVPVDREREVATLLFPLLRELVVVFEDTGRLQFYSRDAVFAPEPFRVIAIFFPAQGVAPETTDTLLLPAVEKLRALEGLDGEIPLSAEGLERLAATPSRETLNTINLLVEFSPRSVALMKQFPKLAQVRCRAAGVKDDGLAALADLPEWLERLHLDGLGVDAPPGERGIAAVAAAPVRHLKLSRCLLFGPRLAAAVARMPRLEHFALQGSRAGDEELTALAGSRTLTALELEGCELQDKNLLRLAAMPRLRSLSLRGNPVSDAGIKALALALPACKIMWDRGEIVPRP